MKYLMFASFMLLLFSCYEEMPAPTSEQDVFELSVSPEMQEILYTSRDSSYEVSGPVFFSYNGQELTFRQIKVRGETSLDFRRKSFAVKLDRPIYLRDAEGREVKKLTRFKLISLSMDYTYMNNRIAFGILEEAGIMPLFYKYVSLWMNGENQGVYFLVEDPEKFYKEQASECILRRGYHHGITDVDYAPGIHRLAQEDYVSRFKEIYSRIIELEGKELHEALQLRLELDQYFRKMVIDYLLKNGDTTDEVYLYSEVEDGEIRYRIIPWDYDDLFSSQPHEVGRDWAVGKLLGERSYPNHQAVLDFLGEKMIFSIEDDLDYKIAADSILYHEYEKVIADVLQILDDNFIDRLFDQVETELHPYFSDEEVIQQSQYDRYPCTYELWEENMTLSRAFILERLDDMRNKLQTRAL